MYRQKTSYLKHDEYSGEQGDRYETNGDGDGRGGRYRQRNRVVFIGRCPLVARVHLGDGRVSRGELRPWHSSLASRRAVPAATWHVFKKGIFEIQIIILFEDSIFKVALKFVEQIGFHRIDVYKKKKK